MNAPANENDWNPCNQVIDELIRLEMERHAWLFEAGKRIDEWREEDGNWDD